MIIEWFKKRKEIKNKEYQDLLLKIKRLTLNNSNNEFTNTISFEKEINKIFIFSDKKDYWKINSMEDLVLNRLVRNLIINMCKDNAFKNEVYNHIFKDKKGKETSVFSLLLESVHRLNKKTQDYFLNAFPLENYFQLYLRNPEENIFLTPIRILLRNKLNDFLIKVCEYYTINEIYDSSRIWAKDPINQTRFLDEVVEMKIKIEELDKKNKNQNNKFEYIINTINLDSLSLTDDSLKNDKKYFIGLLAKSDLRIAKILNDNKVIEKEDLYSVITPILSKYEKENNESEKQNIISLLKDIFKNLNMEEKEINDNCYIAYPQDISKKTYDMWIKEFINEDLNYNNLHPILLGIFSNNELGPDMKLLDFYLNSVVKEDLEVKSKTIFDLYASLCNVNIKENFISNMETYLDYFYYSYNYNLNTSLKNNKNQIMNLPTYALLNGADFKIEHLKLLKDYDFEPFKKFNDSFSFYEVANEEVKNHIANTYMKEKAEFEKEKIDAILKESEVEPENTESYNKKRL